MLLFESVRLLKKSLNGGCLPSNRRTWCYISRDAFIRGTTVLDVLYVYTDVSTFEGEKDLI